MKGQAMDQEIKEMIANLRGGAWGKQPALIGGGQFGPAACAAAADRLDAAQSLLDALDRLLRHCEGTNTAFYVTNKPAALRGAFKGQKEAMQAARAALAKARGD